MNQGACLTKRVDLILDSINGAYIIKDNNGGDEMETVNRDDEKTCDCEQSQNCQEDIDEVDDEEAEAFSTSGIKTLFYEIYTCFSTMSSWVP